jgi:hypothetical protein
MECTLALLCDAANVTVEGKLNLLGTFTEAYPSVYPAIFPRFFLVLSFTAGAAEAGKTRKLRVELVTDEGMALGWAEQEMSVPPPPRPGSRPVMNVILQMDGVSIGAPGDYEFSVLVEADQKTSVGLHLNEAIGGKQGHGK